MTVNIILQFSGLMLHCHTSKVSKNFLNIIFFKLTKAFSEIICLKSVLENFL